MKGREEEMNEGGVSALTKENVQVVAEACGIPALECTAAALLASDAEFRLRMLVDEAKKFAVHAKRWRADGRGGGGYVLTAGDVQAALAVLHEDAVYGHSAAQGAEPAFVRAPPRTLPSEPDADLFYTEDEVVPLADLAAAPLPPCPHDVVLTQHWLAVEGVQPAIPQNPLPRPPQGGAASSSGSSNAAASSGSKGTSSSSSSSSGSSSSPAVRARVAHVLSQEMQLFFQTIVDAVRTGSSMSMTNMGSMSSSTSSNNTTTTSPAFEATLRAIKSDPSVAQLLPYIVRFVADEVAQNLRDLPRLTRVVALADALLDTRTLFVQPYLHQLLPALLTCVVGRQLCADPAAEDHWALRERAGALVARVCRGHPAHRAALEGRVVRTLFHALLDPQRPSTTHYGAITCLTAIGTGSGSGIAGGSSSSAGSSGIAGSGSNTAGSFAVLELLVRNIRLYSSTILKDRMATSAESVGHREAVRVSQALFYASVAYVREATRMPPHSALPPAAVCSAMWDPALPQGRRLIRNMRSLQHVWNDLILQHVEVRPADLHALLAAHPADSDDSSDDDSSSSDADDDDASDEESSSDDEDTSQQNASQPSSSVVGATSASAQDSAMTDAPH